MKKYLIVLPLLIFSTILHAKGGAEHREDMQKVYPFAAEECKPAFDLYELVNAYLDYPNYDLNCKDNSKQRKRCEKPKFLNDDPFKNTIWENHRIWYHWGFSQDPKKFKPLQNKVKQNIDEGKLKDEDVDLFWEQLKKIHSKRNLQLMTISKDFLGYQNQNISQLSEAQRKQVGGFVAILYDIHILGDWMTEKTDVIADVNYIYRDIYTSIEDIAGYKEGSASNNNKIAVRKIKKVLQQHENSPSEFLEALATDFTPFLLSLDGGIYNYKKKFAAIGYKPKDKRYW